MNREKILAYFSAFKTVFLPSGNGHSYIVEENCDQQYLNFFLTIINILKRQTFNYGFGIIPYTEMMKMIMRRKRSEGEFFPAIIKKKFQPFLFSMGYLQLRIFHNGLHVAQFDKVCLSTRMNWSASHMYNHIIILNKPAFFKHLGTIGNGIVNIIGFIVIDSSHTPGQR